jgi:hypothetical protein
MFGWASGSNIQDDYGAAGIYSDAMLSEFRELTQTLIDGLLSPNSPTPVSNNNVVRLKR